MELDLSPENRASVAPDVACDVRIGSHVAKAPQIFLRLLSIAGLFTVAIVLFDGRMQTHLRQQAGSCGGCLSFRQTVGQFRLARFGPLLDRLALVLFERSIVDAHRSERRRQSASCLERLA